MNPDFVSNEQIVLAARRNLSQGVWDHLVGGSESETTMRRNRLAFDRWAFRPRILVDVSSIDPSTTFLGQRLRIPVLLAPLAFLHMFTPGGAIAAGEAAAEFGTVHITSSWTEPASWEEIVRAAGDYPKMFQLYARGDNAWLKDTVSRIKAAGYTALAITVDSATYSRRERPMLTRFHQLAQPFGQDANLPPGPTWDKLDRIREAWDGPLMVKGVATAEDARLCVEHNVDVVWVSNHGGRQLDHALGSMDVLPEVVAAVEGKADVVLDGGVQRGTDVLKAIALGAKAVGIGKLQGWGLGAGGKAGLIRVLEILENEIVSAMGLLGVTSIDQISTDYVARAEPVTVPHEMSAWVNMPGYRIQ